MRLNPFRDSGQNMRAEFKKQMLLEPEAAGDPNSSRKVPLSGSKLTHKQYNEIFEGDSWQLDQPRGHTAVNLRSMHFQSSGPETQKMSSTAEEGLFGTSFGAKRSHAHFTTGDGDDLVQHNGNSQRNISLVEAGDGEKLIVANLGGGDDKAVLFLSPNTTGTVIVDGGEGDNDSLEIHSSNPNQTYTILRDPAQWPDPNDGYKGLRIAVRGVEDIKEFKPEK